MIRLINRRLIIPRGDTGSFTVPVITASSAADASVFTIFDCLTRSKVFQKTITASNGTLTVEFTHADTVNLPPGKYEWDIKFYKNPVYAEGELVDGDEIDSYYAGFTLPICEVRETGDLLQTADDAPTTTINPLQLNIIQAAIGEANATKQEAVASAAAAASSEANAADSAFAANSSAISAEEAKLAAIEAKNTAVSASGDAVSAKNAAEAADTRAQNAASTATSKAGEAAQSAVDAARAKADALAAVSEISNLQVSVSTLGPTVSATASYNSNTGMLSLGIPQGHTISSINKTATSGLVDTYTITFTNGNTTTFTVTNGDSGVYYGTDTPTNPNVNVWIDPSGTNNLVSPTVVVSNIQGGKRIAITDINGTHNADIYNGDAGHLLIHICTAGEYNAETGVPTVQEPNQDTFYLVPGGETGNLYIEWMYVNNNWEKFGNATIDLSDYALKSEIPSKVSDLTDDSGHYTKPVEGIPATDLKETYLTQHQDISGKANSADLAAVATSGSYSDLINTPSIHNVPSGGTIGQVLKKASATDYDTEWSTVNDGTSAYCYIRYSAAEPTQDSDMKTTPDAWMGVYSGTAATAPTHYTDYTWYRIKGETGPVQDVQINGESILNNGVANIPLASNSQAGVGKIDLGFGIGMTSTQKFCTVQATDGNIKAGSDGYRVITPGTQHKSAFYALAKAAGDTSQSASSNPVGTYTEDAKSKISDMLNGAVNVSGSTPSITAKSGVQYVCGEVSTLSITVPESGCFDVIFESGSTATVLSFTLPTGYTKEWTNDFDDTALETDTIYEINIMVVGTKCLGVAGKWT